MLSEFLGEASEGVRSADDLLIFMGKTQQECSSLGSRLEREHHNRKHKCREVSFQHCKVIARAGWWCCRRQFMESISWQQALMGRHCACESQTLRERRWLQSSARSSRRRPRPRMKGRTSLNVSRSYQNKRVLGKCSTGSGFEPVSFLKGVARLGSLGLWQPQSFWENLAKRSVFLLCVECESLTSRGSQDRRESAGPICFDT